MSRSVDERVVEMRFDNQQFEQNIKSTMGMLDRLKQSLKFDGATKGLSDIDKAANNVSLDGIAAGVESLQKQFSTFGIVGMRVIQNLTDSTMRFAKNTVGFVTDSIITGVAAMSNVKASLARIGAESVSPLIVQNGPLEQFLNTLRERMNDVKSVIGSFAETFADFVTAIANSATKFAKDCKGTLIIFSSTIAILAISLGALSMIKPEKLLAASKSLSEVIGIFSLMIAMTAKLEKIGNAKKVALELGALTLVVGAMAGILYLLSGISSEGALGAAASLSMLILALSKCMSMLGEIENVDKSALAVLGVVTAVVAGLAVIIGALAYLDVGSTLEIAASLSMLVLALSKCMSMLGEIENVDKSVLAALGVMTAVVAGLAVIIGTLAYLKVGSTIEIVSSLSMLVLTLSKSMTMLSEIENVDKSVMATLGIMTLVVGGLATIIGVLAYLKVGSTIEIVSSLSMLVLTLSKSMTMIGKVESVDKSVMATLGIMTLVVGGLATIIGVLAYLNVGSTIEIAASLSMLVLALSQSMTMLGEIENVDKSALIALGVMTAVVAGLAVIIGLLAKFNVGPTLEIATSLSILITALSDACQVLGTVGAVGAGAFYAVGALVALVGAMGGLMVAIGALVTYIPEVEEWLDKGIPVLEKIGDGIGKFIGNIAGGIISNALSGLPDIGEKLSSFTESFGSFFDDVKSIDSDSMEGIKTLAEMILILTAADFLDGITSWFTGGSSISEFGEELAEFGKSIQAFGKNVEGINTEEVEKAAAAGKLLAEMADTLPNSGGWAGKIFGENDMEQFAEQLSGFGKALVQFSKEIIEVDVDAIDRVVPAGKALAEMASALPNSGGWIGAMFGENDMDMFGIQLSSFGWSLWNFSMKVKDVDTDAIARVVPVGEALAKMAESIPNSGGLLATFTGDNDMDKFGLQLSCFGEGLKNFSDKVVELNIDDIITAASAGRILSTMAEAIPDDGGLLGIFTGNRNMQEFGEQIAWFGTGLKSFSENVKDTKPDTILSAAGAGKSLAEMASVLTESEYENLDDFGKNLEAFGQSLIKYYNDTSGIEVEKLKSVTDEAKKLAKLVTSDVMNGLVDGAQNNQPAITKAFSSTVTMALKAIQNKRKDFVAEGKTIVSKFASGVKSGTDLIKSVFSKPLNNAVSEIRNKRKDFYSAGSYLVDGFVKGIDENAYKAAAQAKVMAEKADQAARDVLGIESPSTVFSEIGGYVVDGFANGINDNKDKAVQSASGLAQVGVEAAKSVLESLKDSDSVFAEFVQSTDENGDAMGVTLEQAAEAFQSFRNSVKDSVKGATGLFDEFKVETDVTGKELIKNLKSQITGISEWASNIQLLAKRGINQGLLKALSDLGPSGAKYVNALVTMSSKELKKLNKLYKKRLELNDTTADQVAASFLNGGKKAANAYKKGLTEATKNVGGDQSGVVLQEVFRKTGEQVQISVREMTWSVRDILSWTYEDAVKRTKDTLEYGQGAFQQFCDRYLTSTKNIIAGNSAVKAASSALTAYGKKIYEESEYYEEDTKNLKDHQDALVKLQNEKAAIEKDIEKKQKKNTKKSKERVKELQKDLEAVNASIDKTKEQIKEDEKEIADHTKEVFENLHATLADSVSSFLDPLKNGLESGVDLFKKYETNGDLYEKDKQNLEEYQKSLEELEGKQKSILDEINQYANDNTFAARSRIKELKAQLTEVEDSIEETKKNIEQTEKDMESHSEVTVDKILENMQSQIDGVKNWQRDLQTLASKGISQGLYDKLKGMGTDGADYVAQFLKMTNEELSKANELFAESENLSSQTLLNNFKETISTAKNWATGLQELAQMGFAQELLEKLGAMGPDSSDYIRAFLTMTPEQIAEFNQEFANSLVLPDIIADQVMSSYAYAGAQSMAGFKEAITALSEDALESVSGILSKSAGRRIADDVVNGLKEGLLSGSFGVTESARRIGISAYTAVRQVLQIHSPSKSFAELGEYADAGLEKGFLSGEKGIYDTVTGIIDKAIQKVLDIICSDMDMQPAIRPVMDLTDIQNGADAISGMLTGYAVSGSADLAGIAARGMRGYGNQSEDDILNAISKLQKTLSDILDKPSIEQNNNFSITGNDPREIANEVSYILQNQVERRSATWA